MAARKHGVQLTVDVMATVLDSLKHRTDYHTKSIDKIADRQATGSKLQQAHMNALERHRSALVGLREAKDIITAARDEAISLEAEYAKRRKSP